MESTALLRTRSHRFPIALVLTLLLSSVDPSLSFATIPRLSTTAKMSRRPGQASHRYAETKPTETKRRHLPGKVIRIYTDYATRLWKETNPEARDIVRSSKVAMALRQVQSMVSTESGAMDCVPAPDRQELVRACENVLQAIAVNDSKLAKASEEAALVANGQSPTLRQNGESHQPTNRRCSTNSCRYHNDKYSPYTQTETDSSFDWFWCRNGLCRYVLGV
jgi:hypothetical protein